jgi:hypothetical protein
MDNQFKFAVVKSKEDFKLVVATCEKCAFARLEILVWFSVTYVEAVDLKKLGVKSYRVRCECPD